VTNLQYLDIKLLLEGTEKNLDVKVLTWEELRDVWVAADEIPLFESAWNWDHFYPLTGDLTGPCFEAWTMLAAMAQATRRIRLGSQVTGMIYRHPAVLANMASTCRRCASGSTASTRAPRPSSAC
jgi:alkanesulfonate monooxygenase SsuD/methylene tetrahydromethanopterin reductase-like flavin-dependent oxidoreductase (luciferase family)